MIGRGTEIKCATDTVASVCKFVLKQAVIDLGNFQRAVATQIDARSVKLSACLPKRLSPLVKKLPRVETRGSAPVGVWGYYYNFL
jgi:hypothetical protein